MDDTKTTTPTSTFCRIPCLAAVALLAVAALWGFLPAPGGEATRFVLAEMDAVQSAPVTERLPRLQKAKDKQIEALSQAPVDAYGWARLAYLRLVTANDRQGALAALRLSHHVSGFQPGLMVNRAFAFAQLRDLHTEADKKAMERDWRMAWREDHKAVLQILRNDPALIEVVESAMKSDDFEHYKWWKARRSDSL